MTVTGKVIAIMPEEVISDKFKKREFVIETSDKYPQQILLQLVNDNCGKVSNFNIGENVECHINVRGRKSNDRWYNTLECWRIVGFN